MKLDKWQLQVLVEESEQLAWQLRVAWSNSDYNLEDVARVQLRLGEIQLQILQHLFAIEAG